MNVLALLLAVVIAWGAAPTVIKFTNNNQGLNRTAGLVAANSDYTCMVVFSPEGQTSATASPKTVFHARNTGSASEFIRICRTSTGGSTFFRIDVGSTSPTPATVFRAGVPHLVWYVRSGASHHLYVDGELLQTVTLDISAWTLDDVYLATADLTVTSSPVIAVGAFREWSAALTVAQLRAEVNAAAPVVTSGLTCDTPLLADLLDDSGNASDWGLTGAAGTFYKHAILDPTLASQDLLQTIAEHNAVNEILYMFAATATGYAGFTLSLAGADKPRLDVVPPGGIPASTSVRRRSNRTAALSGWFKFVTDEVYALRISNSDANVSADFTLHLELAPTLPAALPHNAHIVNDDTLTFPATVYAEDGTFLGFAETIPASEIGAALPGGYTLWHDRFQFLGNVLALVAPDLSLVSSFNLPGGDAISGFPRLTAANGVFYVLNTSTGAVYTITTAGVATKIATITGYSSSEMAHTAFGVNPGGTILYFTLGEEEGAIKRWDLTTDLALSDLYTISGFSVGNDVVAGTPNGWPGDLIVQSDGSVVTWWVDNAAFENTLLHISAAGVLLLAETFDMTTGAIDHLAPGDNATQVRVWQFEDSFYSRANYYQATLSSGLPSTLTLNTRHNGQGQNFLNNFLSDMFGPSESCTFVIYTVSVPYVSVDTWYPRRLVRPDHPQPPTVFEPPPAPVDVPTPRTFQLRRLRRAPHLCDEMGRYFYDYFELDLETGVGNSDAPDPQLILRWSDDGGKTWSHEVWQSAGRGGDYGRRVEWRRLGQARDRIFELVVSDPVRWRIVQAFLGMTRARR